MKLVELKCKNCGAKLTASENEKKITCNYCQTTFQIEDEVLHVEYDNMEKSGYEFEKGRIKARKEAVANEKEKLKQNYETSVSKEKKEKNKKIILLVLAWIFLLPITATYYLIQSKKLNRLQKILFVILLWIFFFIIVWIGNKEEKANKKKAIVTCYSEETYQELEKRIGTENINGNFSKPYSCNHLNLKTKESKKIEIRMNNKELISILVEDEIIYEK